MREMLALSDCIHDELLHCRPIKEQLSIGGTNHVVPAQRELGIVAVVTASLCADMLFSVDLQDEAVTEQKVNTMTEHPGLRNNTYPKPLDALTNV